MITQLRIRNYKSILDTTMELSNVNVFIGENGCGKTNILEAVGMLSATAQDNTGITILTSKGIRVTRPSLTLSSFLGHNQVKKLNIDFKYNNKSKVFIEESLILEPNNLADIYTDWNITSKDGVSSYKEIMKELFPHFNIFDFAFLLKFTKLHNTGHLVKEVNNKLDGISDFFLYINNFLIFNLNTLSLRGISAESKEVPLGTHVSLIL